MIDDNDIVTALIDVPKYIIEIQPDDVTWIAILNRLLHDASAERQDVVVSIETSRNVYYVRRDFITAEQLATAIGSTADVVARAKSIRLRPFKAEADWQKPTVDYFGQA